MKAFYAGTFDPITNGHLDIIERGALLFDELIVGPIDIPGHKGKTLFDTAERIGLISEATAHLENVTVCPFQSLAVEAARKLGAEALLRGLRAVSDFEYELAIQHLNTLQDPGLETVFLMAKPEHSFISSSGARELARFNGKLDGLVPPLVAEALKEKFPH